MSERQQSVTNILQALYEESPIIKTYVDALLDGNPIPYTILSKTSENEKADAIVERVKEFLLEVQKDPKDEGNDMTVYIQSTLEEKLLEILDEAMTLEDEMYEVVMFKGDNTLESSRQTVPGTKVKQLREFAEFKGFELSVRKIDGN